MADHDLSRDASGMLESSLQALRELPDNELLAGLSGLVRQDRELTVEILLHLGEVEARGLHLAKGCSSLFTYCVERLGFSEEVAYKRVGAARLGRKFPLALELLAQGRLHLTALMLLRPHLTEEDHREWLLLACQKTKREVELLVAARCPRPDVPTTVRKLPELRRALAGKSTVTDAATTADAVSVGLPAPGATATESSGPTIRKADIPRVAPLSGSTYRVTFTASDALKLKLDHAAALVSHSVTPSDLPALIERAIDLLIEREEKRRFAAQVQREGSAQAVSVRRKGSAQATCRCATDLDAGGPGARSEVHGSKEQDPDPVESMRRRKQGKSRRFCRSVATTSRYVPVEVRRFVWQRDQGQCTYVDADGSRCSERRFLQIEHRDPHARGGASTVENCCLLCARHNQYRAKEEFGEAVVESAREMAKAKRSRVQAR